MPVYKNRLLQIRNAARSLSHRSPGANAPSAGNNETPSHSTNTNAASNPVADHPSLVINTPSPTPRVTDHHEADEEEEGKEQDIQEHLSQVIQVDFPSTSIISPKDDDRRPCKSVTQNVEVGTKLARRRRTGSSADYAIVNDEPSVEKISFCPDSVNEKELNESSQELFQAVETNEDDPDWKKFCDTVKAFPVSAHNRLLQDLIELGSSGPALLMKLMKHIVGLTRDGEEGLYSVDDNYVAYAKTVLNTVISATVQHEDSSGIITDLVSVVLVELHRFTTDVLKDAVEGCLMYLQNDWNGHLPQRWIETFGQIVRVLASREDIFENSLIVSSHKYRQYIFREIWLLNWSSENIVTLIMLVRHLPDLDGSEVKTIMEKVHEYLSDIRIPSVAPLMSQLIQLVDSKASHVEVISMCMEYFLDVDFTNNEKLTMLQKRNVLGTVIFHFLNHARVSNALVKDVLKLIKSPWINVSTILNPFMLFLIFGLAKIDHYRNDILESLRNVVSKAFYSQTLCHVSGSYRASLGYENDEIYSNFVKIFGSRGTEVDIIADGIREMGMALLSNESIETRYPGALEMNQKFGKYLLITLIKTSPEPLFPTIKSLLKHCNKTRRIFVDCFAEILDIRTRQIIHPDFLERTSEIIRHLPQMDSCSAASLVAAMFSALQLNNSLMDQLLSVIRKTQWSSMETRRTTAKITILLLSNAKMMGEVPFSQYSRTQQQRKLKVLPSDYQLPDKQPLCVEILAIIKRSLDQQKEVKEELYYGLPNVVKNNPATCELVSSMVLNHSLHCFPDDKGGVRLECSPILQIMCVDDKQIITVKEDLGMLIQCMSLVAMEGYKVFQSVEAGPPASIIKLERKVRHVIQAILSCDIQNLETVAEQIGGGSKQEPQSFVTHCYTQVALGMQIVRAIEALIEFLNIDGKEKDAPLVKKLFQKYLIWKEHFTQKANELKKESKSGKGKKDSTGDKKSCSSSEYALKMTLVQYAPVMKLENALNLLICLLGSETEKGALNLVYQQSEFKDFLLLILQHKLDRFAINESMCESNKNLGEISILFCKAAGLLWNGLLARKTKDVLPGLANDSKLILLQMEFIQTTLRNVCRSNDVASEMIINALADVAGTEMPQGKKLQTFFKLWMNLRSSFPIDQTEIQICLFNILTSFGQLIKLRDDIDFAVVIQVKDWIGNFIQSVKGKRTHVATLDFAETCCVCWLTLLMKTDDAFEQNDASKPTLYSLACALLKLLGRNSSVHEAVMEDEHAVFWILNTNTAPAIFCANANHLKEQLDHIIALIGRLVPHPLELGNSCEIQSKIWERCVTMITKVLEICSKLLVTKFPAGACSTNMLKLVARVYDVMACLARSFIEKVKRGSDFKVLVKGFLVPVNLIGKVFQTNVDAMIDHIEEIEREEAKKVVSGSPSESLKGRRNIEVSRLKKNLSNLNKLISTLAFNMGNYDKLILTASNLLEKKKEKCLIQQTQMRLSTLRDIKIDIDKLGQAGSGRTASAPKIGKRKAEENDGPIDNA